MPRLKWLVHALQTGLLTYLVSQVDRDVCYILFPGGKPIHHLLCMSLFAFLWVSIITNHFIAVDLLSK